MKKPRFISLQTKIMLIVVWALLVVLIVSFSMMSLLREMSGKIEKVYTSNLNLNDLDTSLQTLEKDLETYVSTKSSDAMEDYYRDEQNLRELIGGLNDRPVDDAGLTAEKNIHNLTESYLDLTAKIIQAKRGRNVQKYADLSEQASLLSSTIHVYINSLNSERFQVNSETFSILTKRLERQENRLHAVLLVVMVAVVAAFAFLSSMILKPLRNLAKAANEMAAGNLEQEALPVETGDEIGIMTDAFNQMVASIRDYIRQTRENLLREQALREKELLMEGHLKDARLKYLQAQINPHFLFNTLNACAQLAMMEGAEKTEELLDNTAAFFRYNARRDDRDTTLRDEVGLVDNYIYISKVRFGDSFFFEKDIDDSVLDLQVPSMILQPLIENSFKYGIRDLDLPGRIELSIRRVGDWAEISVWDNGKGMTQDKIREILAGHAHEAAESKYAQDSNGVGIWNVRERLRLYFADRSTFEISSDGPDTGTEILIRIPIGKEAE